MPARTYLCTTCVCTYICMYKSTLYTHMYYIYTFCWWYTVEHSYNKLLYNKVLDITKQWSQPCATVSHRKLSWYNKLLLITNRLPRNYWFVIRVLHCTYILCEEDLLIRKPSSRGMYYLLASEQLYQGYIGPNRVLCSQLGLLFSICCFLLCLSYVPCNLV